MRVLHFALFWISLLLLGAAGCGIDQRSSAAALSPIPLSPTPSSESPLSPTPSSKAPIPLSSTPATRALTPRSTPSPLSPALLLTPSPTPCPPDTCIYTGAFQLTRPIAAPGRDSIDPSYRFGSTQGGQRDPHHGVEFLNPAGTPVLAAAAGVVVVTGDDTQTRYAPYFNFYGNLVMLEHDLPGVAQPVFTLYAHLSQVLVRVGQRVESGQHIGAVGMTGSATGSHLHFEVRLGENSYAAARNPELWLAPRLDETGQAGGAIAGRILAPQGFKLEISSIVLEQLPSPERAPVSQVYLGIYEDKALPGQLPWGESFAAGDLPAGWYRVSFIQYGMQERLVQVLPGQLTVVTFQLGQETP